MPIQFNVYELFSKGASKMGYFFVIDKNDISLCKLGKIYNFSSLNKLKKLEELLNLKKSFNLKIMTTFTVF